MKKVYLNAVLTYSKNIKEAIAQAIAASKARELCSCVESWPLYLATLFILNGIVLQAQNCPTSGTTVLNEQ